MHPTYVISQFQRIGKIYTEQRQAVEPVDRRIVQRRLAELQIPSSYAFVSRSGNNPVHSLCHYIHR